MDIVPYRSTGVSPVFWRYPAESIAAYRDTGGTPVLHFSTIARMTKPRKFSSGTVLALVLAFGGILVSAIATRYRLFSPASSTQPTTAATRE